MITDKNNRWHYLAVKSLPALFRGTTSNHHGDFYCLNCFHSYTTHNKLKKHERVCNNHDYSRVDMPKEYEKIKYLPGEKSLKALFMAYVDLECLLKKCHLVKITPKILTQRKNLSINIYDTSWCSICSFDDAKNRRYFYGRKDYMEKFCKDLKEIGQKQLILKKKK